MQAVLMFIQEIAPLISLLVHFVEQQHPEGQGAVKFQKVIGTVQILAKEIPELAGKVEAVAQSATPLIEGAVQVMKQIEAQFDSVQVG